MFRCSPKCKPDQHRYHGVRQSMVVWITGLSGAGKSTLAIEVAGQLRAKGEHVALLDGLADFADGLMVKGSKEKIMLKLLTKFMMHILDHKKLEP